MQTQCKHDNTDEQTIGRISIEQCKHCKAFRRIGFWDKWHDNFTENISRWLYRTI